MPADESLSFVYITAPDKADALRIGRALVHERLCACVNVIDGMTSVYHWQGAIEESSEAVLIGKTVHANVDRVIERVKQLHGYECPCVVSWPIDAGNPDYLDWLRAEVNHSPPA